MSQATAEQPAMNRVTPAATVETLHIVNEISIEASPEIVWESVLARHREGVDPNGKPMEWKFEAWPGGRWYRDLGNSAGHLWGHVQVIKPAALLEIAGPLFMSYAVASHVQYRLKAEGETTRLIFTHTAVGLIPQEHRDGVQKGWGEFLKKIRTESESRAKA